MNAPDLPAVRSKLLDALNYAMQCQPDLVPGVTPGVLSGAGCFATSTHLTIDRTDYRPALAELLFGNAPAATVYLPDGRILRGEAEIAAYEAEEREWEAFRAERQRGPKNGEG